MLEPVTHFHTVSKKINGMLQFGVFIILNAFKTEPMPPAIPK
jgi:hypothetical protein